MKISTSSQLKQLIHQSTTFIAPGVFDGLSALLAQAAGFQLLYASGGAIARSAGYPDLGLITLTEMTHVLSHIIQATPLPVIADADTGFGNAANTRRTVQLYEQVGAAGLHLEDQTFPKRCGHLEGKSLIPCSEMCHKLQVARDSLKDPDFILIARTDAIAVEGLDSALRRATAYLNAGADMIFIEAPETLSQIKTIADTLPQPKLINLFQGGKTPWVPMAQLQEWGYRIVILPSDLQRAALKAMQTTLAEIYRSGNSASLSEQMVTFQERERIVKTQDYLSL